MEAVISARPRRAADPVTVWLFLCCAMVAVMVALGGLTRLTGSGLSMVEWNPHHLLPPLTPDQWQEAFAKYRASPEYRLVNAGMDLAGFQGIFWLEYIHRLWGRMIGAVFLLPLVVFAWKGRVDRPLVRRLAGLFLLGGAQGALGWFMVASGLVDRPEVSHYRLAAHLVLALVILAALLWTALDRVEPPAARPAPRLRMAQAGLLALAFLTLTWGAFVAGMDAGLVYNSFPLMNGQLLPSDGLDPFRTHGGVQFAHRLLAVSTVLAVTGVWLWSRRLDLAPRTRQALGLAALWVWGQAGLGVATLLLMVPVPLASAHQMGAVLLVSLLTWALHTTRSA